MNTVPKSCIKSASFVHGGRKRMNFLVRLVHKKNRKQVREFCSKAKYDYDLDINVCNIVNPYDIS